jgi:hypothetical protein
MRFETPLGGHHYKKCSRPQEEALRHELGCNFQLEIPEASWMVRASTVIGFGQG